MNRKLLIAVATVALGMPLAPAAFAGDDHRGGGGGGGGAPREDYRRDGRGGWDRGGRGHDHDHSHGSRYVIHYELNGGRGQRVAKDSDQAERMVDFLRSVGADAHIDGRRVVHYRLRGERHEYRRSHEDAHKLVERLQNYGIRARVEHT